MKKIETLFSTKNMSNITEDDVLQRSTRKPQTQIENKKCLHNKTSQNIQAKENVMETIDSDVGHVKYALRKEMLKLNKTSREGFSVGLVDDANMLTWEVILFGPRDTHYMGGIFKCILEFPDKYPLMPPSLTFISEIWHPNVAKNGRVCLSIFNQPGDDPFGFEKAHERWLPVYNLDTIILFVLSMLADPNPESPANVDAAKELRENSILFKKKVLQCVRKSEEAFVCIEDSEYFQENAKASRLFKKELDQMTNSPLDGISAGLIDDEDLFIWKVIIFGPPGTLYEGALFMCILEFND